MLKSTFDAARKESRPSVLFFDEIDSLVSSRGEESEHEASRRFKSELLTQMDGITSDSSTRVVVIAATNTPWDLDEAMRRRLEKRIYVPLPNENSRLQAFQIHLSGSLLGDDVDLAEIAKSTAGLSGADIKSICKEASMMPLRRMLEVGQSVEEMKEAVKDREELKLLQDDFVTAVKNIPASVATTENTKFENWEKEFAS